MFKISNFISFVYNSSLFQNIKKAQYEQPAFVYIPPIAGASVDVRYFPKGIFPNGDFPSGIFPSGLFPIVAIS